MIVNHFRLFRIFFVATVLPFFHFVSSLCSSDVDANQLTQLGGIALLVGFACLGGAGDDAAAGAGLGANQEVQQANSGTNGVDARGSLVAAMAARDTALEQNKSIFAIFFIQGLT